VSRIFRFAWATLCFNVAVVLWGAFVRATGSGAGCGNQWPGCGGTVLGTSVKAQTIIEFTHRMTSVVALLMVTILVLWCWRTTSKGNWARYSALLAAVFLANEALLGAALVLLGHVARDRSAGRTVFLCLHFGNTLLLLATLALTAAWLQSGRETFTLIQQRSQVSAVVVGLLAVLAIGMTGTVAPPSAITFSLQRRSARQYYKTSLTTALVSCTFGCSIPSSRSLPEVMLSGSC
jgi:heme a synthase